MPLVEGQVQVRDLVMGPGTPYRVLPGFDPFTREVRANQGGPRAWSHGSWSGAEWANEAVVPIPISVTGTSRSPAAWVAAHQQLAAAFRAVGDEPGVVELRWRLGDEYVMFGRPRLVSPDMLNIGAGKSFTRAAFVAQDPRIYSGQLHSTGQISLPVQVGGLLLPAMLPTLIPGGLLGGSAPVVNAGTADAPLLARLDGPLAEPRIVLQRPNGSLQSVRFDLMLPAGQWIELDSAAGTAFVNGLPGSSVYGDAIWDMDQYPLAPGTTVVRIGAADVDSGTLTVTHRSAWW